MNLKLIDDTKQRVLAAAGTIFAEKGFEATTIREIQKRAGVNIAAVNYHFGDKQQLYIEAVKNAFRFEDAVLEQFDETDRQPPANQLRSFVRHFLQALLDADRPAWHMLLLSRELSQPTEGCRAFVRDFARPRFEQLMRILATILPPATSDVDRHLTAISIIGQCVHHRCARPIISMLVGEAEFQTYDLDRLAAHIAGFSLAALGLQTALGNAASSKGDQS